MTYMLKELHAKGFTLKNRLVMPPMATAKAEADGKVSQDIIDFYDEKSRGGYISLIIVEHCFFAIEGKAGERQLYLGDDSVIEGLQRLAETIHNNGTKAVIQINHAGSAALEEVTGTMPVAPSAVANPRKTHIPRELSKEEIKDFIEGFAAAACRVKAAGFDGVEIHSAHGYLLNQFFSPLTNKRTDEYGGSVYNRIRIHLEVIEAIKGAAGPDFPILLRLGASDYMEGGTTIEDAQIAAKEFEKAGICILDISGGHSGSSAPGQANCQGYFAPLSAAVKEAVAIPVILTGGITEIQAAEQLLAEGKADLIGVGRAILKDSQWAKKAIEELS